MSETRDVINLVSASQQQCDVVIVMTGVIFVANDDVFTLLSSTADCRRARLRGRQAERDSGWTEVYEGIRGTLATLMEYVESVNCVRLSSLSIR